MPSAPLIDRLAEGSRRRVADAAHWVGQRKFHIKSRLGLLEPLRIVAFHGYGTLDSIWIGGRVPDVPDARLRVRIGSAVAEVDTDAAGLFSAELSPKASLAPRRLWHPVDIELVRAGTEAPEPSVCGLALTPTRQTRLGVLSDVSEAALRRAPAAALAALHRALQVGKGAEQNLVFYVSDAPYAAYEIHEAALERHRFPRGPLLLADARLLGARRSAQQHKLRSMSRVLERYPDLEFVCVAGDAELAAQAVERFPERIVAAYVTALAGDAFSAPRGDDVLFSGDVLEIAAHAAKLGLVAEDTARAIRSQLEN